MNSNSKVDLILKYIQEKEQEEYGYWEWELPHIIKEMKSFDETDWQKLKKVIFNCSSHQQNVIGDALGEFQSEINDNEQFYGEIFLNTPCMDTSLYLLTNLVNIGANQSIEYYKTILDRLEILEKVADKSDMVFCIRHREWISDLIKRKTLANTGSCCTTQVD